jgi:hypothetical protein
LFYKAAVNDERTSHLAVHLNCKSITHDFKDLNQKNKRKGINGLNDHAPAGVVRCGVRQLGTSSCHVQEESAACGDTAPRSDQEEALSHRT